MKRGLHSGEKGWEDNLNGGGLQVLRTSTLVQIGAFTFYRQVVKEG